MPRCADNFVFIRGSTKRGVIFFFSKINLYMKHRLYGTVSVTNCLVHLLCVSEKGIDVLVPKRNQNNRVSINPCSHLKALPNLGFWACFLHAHAEIVLFFWTCVHSRRITRWQRHTFEFAADISYVLHN